MSELDFQMALLLQHQFEQEYKSKRNEENSDFALARALQEQFQHELAVEKPHSNLVYDEGKKALNTSKCLTDPSWELVDPTPDVHNLFIAFNRKFFWGQLDGVCICWSKRMTTCAGICSYEGRGGMCTIALSEPLLKLRPRKDLVETLLHEMIHAYLFVTNNNRDRDGHGPEFHKHMYRINAEAGTNITVYHNFHDEVRLYQQHWWRCDGPCQQRKPYFGMVRRATNRAPGPNDRWWGEHSRTCGGAFSKVKEPDKSAKSGKNGKHEVKGKNGDIRSFIPVIAPVGTKSTSSGSTVINISTSPPIGKTNPASQKSEINAFISVRNHWANKYPTKRPSSGPERSPKLPKTSKSIADDAAQCPVCNLKLPFADLNPHLDLCLTQSSSEETKKCPLCSTAYKTCDFDSHVAQCVMKVYSGIEETLEIKKKEENIDCLVCKKTISKEDLNSHLDECMDGFFELDNEGKEEKENHHQFNCPFCMKLVEESVMKSHIDGCLKDDNLEEFLIDGDFS